MAHIGLDERHIEARRESFGSRGVQHRTRQIRPNDVDSVLRDLQGQAAGPAAQFEHTAITPAGFIQIELFGGNEALLPRRIVNGSHVFSRRKQEIVELRIVVKTALAHAKGYRCKANRRVP